LAAAAARTAAGLDHRAVEADVPHLVLRKAALLRGIPDDEIARLRRTGRWTALQRGAYSRVMPS